MGDLKDWLKFMIKNKKIVMFSSFFRHKYSPSNLIKRQIGDFKFEIKESNDVVSDETYFYDELIIDESNDYEKTKTMQEIRDEAIKMFNPSETYKIEGDIGIDPKAFNPTLVLKRVERVPTVSFEDEMVRFKKKGR